MFYFNKKKYFLKKYVSNWLQNQQPNLEHHKIESIGLLVDESYFSNSANLFNEILKKGFKKEQVTVLIYKDKIKPKEVIQEPFLSLKNISIEGEFDKPEVNSFLETPFDLLINYYDVNKSGIMLLSLKSKAKFKVGFETVDKRVNHIIIKELVENYKAFVSELFKYLKILNKI